MGGALNQLIELVGAQKAQIEQLTAQVNETKRIGLEALTVAHHTYMTHPQLSQSVADKRTLPEFRQFLAQFVGPQ